MNTAEELQRALSAGASARDIEIRTHLDLRVLKLQDDPFLEAAARDSYEPSHVAYLAAPTRSIRVCFGRPNPNHPADAPSMSLERRHVACCALRAVCCVLCDVLVPSGLMDAGQGLGLCCCSAGDQA